MVCYFAKTLPQRVMYIIHQFRANPKDASSFDQFPQDLMLTPRVRGGEIIDRLGLDERDFTAVNSAHGGPEKKNAYVRLNSCTLRGQGYFGAWNRGDVLAWCVTRRKGCGDTRQRKSCCPDNGKNRKGRHPRLPHAATESE